MRNDCDIGGYPFISEWTNSSCSYSKHLLELSGLSSWLLTAIYKMQYKFGHRGSLWEVIKHSLSISSKSWPHETEVETAQVSDYGSGLQVHKCNIHKTGMAWQPRQFNPSGIVLKLCIIYHHYIFFLLSWAWPKIYSCLPFPDLVSLSGNGTISFKTDLQEPQPCHYIGQMPGKVIPASCADTQVSPYSTLPISHVWIKQHSYMEKVVWSALRLISCGSSMSPKNYHWDAV